MNNNINNEYKYQKLDKKAPQKETLNLYNEIKQFVKKQQTQEERRINTQLRDKIKLPYKMYKAIKVKVKKKYENEKIINLNHGIIGQTGLKDKKLMTKFVERKIDKEDEYKNNFKLKFSRGKNKSKFKDGVMNVNNNFIKSIKNTGINTNDNNKKKYKFAKGKKK